MQGVAAGFEGTRHTRWSVLSFARKSNPEKPNSDSLWNCICDCGTKREVTRGSLRQGRSKSCGCLKSENLRTHGLSRNKTTEYVIWDNFVQRCTNPKHPRYADYGGRGIGVDTTWLGVHGCKTFIADMGARPTGLTLDRIDNDKGYSKDNCRWTTYIVQNNNRRPRRRKVS